MNQLPPRSRKLRAELPPDLYLRLEQESFERQITPYKLASTVMALYLRGELVPTSSDTSQEPPLNPCPSPSLSVAGTLTQGAGQ